MAGPGPDSLKPSNSSEGGSLDPGEQSQGSEPAVMYCVNHPHTETLLRCSRCLAPICTRCAISTPVGYRCPQCVRRNRSPLYVVEPQHAVIAALVSFVLSSIAAVLISQVWLLLTFFLSPSAGGLIGEAVLRTAGGKRGRSIQVVTGVGIVLGAMVGPMLWAGIVSGGLGVLLANPLIILTSLFNLRLILYAVLAVGAAVARLR